MKTKFTFIYALFFLCGSHFLSAQTLFTWTDEAGVVDITGNKPPGGINIDVKRDDNKQPSKRAS